MKKHKTIRCTTTTYDRVQALIRNPEYLKDYQELISKGRGSGHYRKKYDAFIGKYHLTVPLDPGEFKQYLPETLENVALFTDGFVIPEFCVNLCVVEGK